MAQLKIEYAAQPQLLRFWENLQPVYQYFEANKAIKVVKVDTRGQYSL
jgi:hypothetical protein